jgi:hypothetical protein
METGALPWEATRAALDLLRYFQEKNLGRPTVRLTTWYWKVCLATPDVDEAMDRAVWVGEQGQSHRASKDEFPFTAYLELDKDFHKFVELRLTMAGLLAAQEQLRLLRGVQIDTSAVERELAFRSWRSIRSQVGAKDAAEQLSRQAAQLLVDSDPQIVQLASDWFPHYLPLLEKVKADVKAGVRRPKTRAEKQAEAEKQVAENQIADALAKNDLALARQLRSEQLRSDAGAGQRSGQGTSKGMQEGQRGK